MKAPAISVIICSNDAAEYAHVTANYRKRLAGQPHEIIGIHDARSLAEGYNRGARLARGDLLIFSHDDVEIVSPDLAGAITRATATVDVIGVVGTSKVLGGYWPAAGHPYLHGWLAQPVPGTRKFYVGVFGVDGALSPNLQGLDGMFFVAKRCVVESVPFDEVTFDGFHCYDIDFSFAAHLAGFRIGTTADIALIHASGGKFGDAWQRYAERFAAKYRDRLPTEQSTAKWSYARRLVESKDAILRDFPMERLVAITRQLRAAAAPRSA
jgi:GT2 family glycosyltransferase